MCDAWIVSIGNELLIGRVVNSNLAWLGKKLTYLGFNVRRGLIVRDDCEEIAWAFRLAVDSGAKVIVSTGGLGPTFDDKTSECLSRAFKLRFVVNEEALRLVSERYSSAGLEMNDYRVKMAMMPEGAEPLPNPVGTAPGIKLKVGETYIFVLPGVPSEMKAIFEEYVEPFLRKVGPEVEFFETELISKGLPESSIAPIIDKVMKKYPRVYIKSHPSGKELEAPVQRLHIQLSSKSKEEALKTLKEVEEELATLLSKEGAEVIRSSP